MIKSTTLKWALTYQCVQSVIEEIENLKIKIVAKKAINGIATTKYNGIFELSYDSKNFYVEYSNDDAVH